MDVLLVTADTVLLDDLLRLAAAADAEPTVASEIGRVRAGWRDAALVLLGSDLAADVAAGSPPRRAGVVLVAADAADDEVYRLAVDVGAQDVVSLPEAEPWLIERMASAGRSTEPRGTVVAILGGRGGAGASVLSTALATAASRRRLAALLVDGDPLGGGIDLVLGAEDAPGPRWPEFLDRRGRLNADALSGVLPCHNGVSVLSWHRGDAAPLPATAMRAVLDAAGTGFDLVVADVARHVAEAGVEVLLAADVTLVLVPAEVRATVAADRVGTLVRPHATDVRVLVRGPAPGGLAADVIAESLGLPLAGRVPHDRRLAAALERGEPPGRAGPLAGFCDRLLSELMSASSGDGGHGAKGRAAR